MFRSQLQLNLQRVFAVGPEDSTYIFDMAGSSDTKTLAVSASNHCIKLYDMASLSYTSQLTGHTAQISAIRFSKHSPSTLWSSSGDGTVRMWDLRAGTQVTSYAPNNGRFEMSAMDVNCTEKVVAAGTLLKGSEAKLCFWDIRGGKPSKEFIEVHNDDITQVVFHPNTETVLATGSTDGLVNVIDLKLGTEEDDCMATVCNSESSVAKIGFAGPGYRFIYCNTHIESFFAWDAIEGTKQVSIPDVRTAMETAPVDYIIANEYDEQANEIYLLCGTHGGDIVVSSLRDGKLVPAMSLSGGHKEVVRCCYYDKQMGALYTGGEDAMMCKWSTDTPSQQVAGSGQNLKLHAGQKQRRSPY